MPPKYATLAQDCFELKAIKKQQMQKRSLLSPICLKTGHKNPFVKVFPLRMSIRGKKRVIITGDRKRTLRGSAQVKLTKMTLISHRFSPYIYLPTLYCSQESKHFSLLFNHFSVIYHPLLKWYKALEANCFFEFSFHLGRILCTKKLKY